MDSESCRRAGHCLALGDVLVADRVAIVVLEALARTFVAAPHLKIADRWYLESSSDDSRKSRSLGTGSAIVEARKAGILCGTASVFILNIPATVVTLSTARRRQPPPVFTDSLEGVFLKGEVVVVVSAADGVKTLLVFVPSTTSLPFEVFCLSHVL